MNNVFGFAANMKIRIGLALGLAFALAFAMAPVQAFAAIERSIYIVQIQPGTDIEVLTAPSGVAYIETRFEALLGAHATAELAAQHHEGADAVIVAAFGDPGLMALREVLPGVDGRDLLDLLERGVLGDHEVEDRRPAAFPARRDVDFGEAA